MISNENKQNKEVLKTKISAITDELSKKEEFSGISLYKDAILSYVLNNAIDSVLTNNSFLTTYIIDYYKMLKKEDLDINTLIYFDSISKIKDEDIRDLIRYKYYKAKGIVNCAACHVAKVHNIQLSGFETTEDFIDIISEKVSDSSTELEKFVNKDIDIYDAINVIRTVNQNDYLKEFLNGKLLRK